MSKRIHELAKDWGVAAKDLVAAAEKVGIRGKRSQSSLTEEEVRAVRQAPGLEPRPAGRNGARGGPGQPRRARTRGARAAPGPAGAGAGAPGRPAAAVGCRG